ncbi:MAG: DUF4126 domain-containing protein [Verrucomicrobia bacterium]|nr:DUF4126 domain-containing protein [Verrucomicrobiota bacterium]
MDVLQHLGLALGFATLAGINLYLTVFATSLALHQGWIVLSPQYHDLQVLDHPAVLIVSGALYFIQFFADKVPWVDSAWDLLHTAIRPLGAAFLAIKTLGTVNPVFDVIIALLAGSVALTAHGAKAGTRLLANGSPEPFSNIALSVTEDAAVFGGLSVLAYTYWSHPLLALIVFSTVVSVLFVVTPRVFRFSRTRLWLFWKKLTAPAAALTPTVALPKTLTADADILLRRETTLESTVAWALPCLSAGSKGIPANLHGWLIAIVEEPRQLFFVARRGWRKVSRTLELAGYKVSHEPRFLCENLILYGLDKQPKHVFIFDRTQAQLVAAAVTSLRERLEAPAGALPVDDLNGTGASSKPLNAPISTAESPALARAS